MGRYPWSWFDANDWGIWAYTGGGQRGRFFGSGEVRIAILSLLSEGPKHGYELIKELEARSGGSYRVSAGTMYPTLQQLEDEGMIVCEQKNSKKVYSLTDLGKAELGREGRKADQIWQRASEWGDWAQFMGPEAAIVAKPLGAVVKATFRAAKRCGNNPSKREQIEDILDRTRIELESLCV